MKYYTTKLVSPSETERIKEWAKSADVAYNLGVIRSCEVVLFHDIEDNRVHILISDSENEVCMSQDIMNFLSSGTSMLVLTHNHNGTETCFSNRDIEALLDYTRINYMIVINSNKEVYVLGKSQHTESRDKVMELFWRWWSDSEKYALSLRHEATKILAFSPVAMHADQQEYENLLRIEDGIMAALHNMAHRTQFLNFAENAGFYGACLIS